MRNSMQTCLDFCESRENSSPVMVSGVVVRHLLATNENGRYLDFSVVNRSETTRCRYKVSDQLGTNLAHGKRYAVVGHFVDVSGDQVLLVRVFVALGHVEGRDRHAPYPEVSKRKTRYRHPALRRTEIRNSASRRPQVVRASSSRHLLGAPSNSRCMTGDAS